MRARISLVVVAACAAVLGLGGAASAQPAARPLITTGGLPAATAQPARLPYDQARLQRDLDAIHATGVSGVLARVESGQRTLAGTSGVADLGSGGPVEVNGSF